MLNKIYKNIHNKYSTLFKFLFFLRYLFGIFFISVVLFLSIPQFFDFKKKDKFIKDYLLESYGLKLLKYENIKYNVFPLPNLEIQNVSTSIKADIIQMDVTSLNIYPKLLNIYDYEDFEANKIVFIKNKILLEEKNLKHLIEYISNLKNKLVFKNLDLKIDKNKSPLINLNNIFFSNYGYDKNIIRGNLFDKKFKILISDDYNRISFKLLKTGITADIKFNEIKKNSIINGVFKSKLLNSKLKFDFNYDEKKFTIYNSYFRSKNLSFSNESEIIYQPFFYLHSFFEIEDINVGILKNIDIKKNLASKEFIKKINTKNEINFKSKKFSQSLIDDLNLDISIAYGKLVYFKKFSISNNFFTCSGDINLLEEYPILYFDCSVKSTDKKKLLKKFSIKYKNKNELFNINVKGNINIFNNKINFKNILMNDNYKAKEEDLNYFKQVFETILFDKDFFGIFNFLKIRNFILEIS
jgi:hypothetical protein